MQIFVLERSYKGGVEWWPPGSVPKQKGKLWLIPSFQVVLQITVQKGFSLKISKDGTEKLLITKVNIDQWSWPKKIENVVQKVKVEVLLSL